MRNRFSNIKPEDVEKLTLFASEVNNILGNVVTGLTEVNKLINSQKNNSSTLTPSEKRMMQQDFVNYKNNFSNLSPAERQRIEENFIKYINDDTHLSAIDKQDLINDFLNTEKNQEPKPQPATPFKNTFTSPPPTFVTLNSNTKKQPQHQNNNVIKQQVETIIVKNGKIIEKHIKINNNSFKINNINIQKLKPNINNANMQKFESNIINNKTYDTKKEFKNNINISEPKVDPSSEFKKETLLTPTEKMFFNQLLAACNNLPVIICPKVRLEDIISAKKGSNNWSNRGRIKCRHIDFVVYDKNFNVILGIELDDHYHNNKKRKEEDAFKNKIFAESGVTLERIKVKNNYNKDIEKIVAIINAKLK